MLERTSGSNSSNFPCCLLLALLLLLLLLLLQFALHPASTAPLSRPSHASYWLPYTSYRTHRR
jgi:hypothetical protein